LVIRYVCPILQRFQFIETTVGNMKIESVQKSLFVSGECSNSKRPRGERFEIWLNGENVGVAPIHEWHVNCSGGRNRRTFALTCQLEESPYETALSRSPINKLEFREVNGQHSIVLDSVKIRGELRLLLDTDRHEGRLGGGSFELISATGDVSFIAYVPDTSSDSVEAIVTEIGSDAEAKLRRQGGLELTVIATRDPSMRK
jgi:hypothetical protein